MDNPEKVSAAAQLESGNTLDSTSSIDPPIYPKTQLVSPEKIEEFLRIRKRILDVISVNSPQTVRVIEDIADAVFELDPSIPTGIISGIQLALKVGKAVREKQRRRELYRQVVRSIMEKIFDPPLRYKMTKKDILDAFEAKGFERDKVTNQQISKIYVTILEHLKSGELRELTYEEQLYVYVHHKIELITLSRQDWELNGR